jgi:hypothetical protein
LDVGRTGVAGGTERSGMSDQGYTAGCNYLGLAVTICSFRKKILKKLILEIILMLKKAFLPSKT